jgi:hypothetical protein
MGVVAIDPATGDWKQLLDNSNDGFEISPDGETMTFTRAIGIDGSNDRLLFQAPGLTFVMMARWSRNGKELAAVLLDLKIGDDNQPRLSADSKVTHPRIAIISLATGESRVLNISLQNGREFCPCSHIEWK